MFFLTAMLFYFNSSFAVLSTPSITSPINNSTKVLNKVTIVCTTVSNGFYYVFEWDSVSTFNSGYYKKSKRIAGTSYVIDSLPFNKNHYIRVKAFNSLLTDSSAKSATVKFTTFGNFTLNSLSPSYALLGFGWIANAVVKMEIQIDTTKLYNSVRFKSYISETTSVSYCTFKYTKSIQNYYYRYRSVYGTNHTGWTEGTLSSNKGFILSNSTLTDSFLLEKTIGWTTNYNGDSSVTYDIQIDTVNTFNSVNLFKTSIYTNKFSFLAKPQRKYFMKMVMTYPGNVWPGDSIYTFLTAKNSPPYTVNTFGDVFFTLPPNLTKGTIEMDTTLKFNSSLKIHYDTIFPVSSIQRYLSIYYLSIKKYHKMYLRYKVSSSSYELDWYCPNKRFFMPVYNVPTSNVPPIQRLTNQTGFNDISGIAYEVDTTLKFNSKLKIKNSYLIAKSDSIRTLKFGKNYFLRAKYFNANNDTTQWGNPFSFKTLDTVRIQSPNGSQYYFNSFNVSSDNVPGVKIYNWQLDTNLDFRTKVDLNSYRNYFTSNEMPRLVVGKKYYWQMRLISLVDTSKWSRIGSINLITSSDLPYPFLIYPPNNSTNIAPANINFLWKDNTGGIGSSYEFYITSPMTPLSIASVATNTIPLKNLMPNTTYTWYVLSYRKNYNSEVPILSQRFTFTTSSNSDIAGLDKNATLLVYPNPAYSTLSIQLKTGDKIESLNIRNIEGKLIYEQNFVNSNLFEIDISAFKKGMYIASCQSNRGVYVSKFIKE